MSDTEKMTNQVIPNAQPKTLKELDRQVRDAHRDEYRRAFLAHWASSRRATR